MLLCSFFIFPVFLALLLFVIAIVVIVVVVVLVSVVVSVAFDDACVMALLDSLHLIVAALAVASVFDCVLWSLL